MLPGFSECGEVAERLCVGLQSPFTGVQIPSSPLNIIRDSSPFANLRRASFDAKRRTASLPNIYSTSMMPAIHG